MESRFVSPPLPGTREAADLAALRHAARDMEDHIAACESVAANVPAAARAISVRIDLGAAPGAPQTLALALSVAGGVLAAIGDHLSSPGASAE